MNKYSELTDEAINVKIKDLRFGSGNWHKENCLLRINHCGSWNDTGPLIEKYDLEIAAGKAVKYFVYGDRKHIFVNSTTTLRAICECILLINDREGK